MSDLETKVSHFCLGQIDDSPDNCFEAIIYDRCMWEADNSIYNSLNFLLFFH